MSIEKDIIEWNKDRGLLEEFDPMLELKMLSEEVSEFYHAESLAHMFQEYADFLFVKAGTYAKFFSKKHSSTTLFASDLENWNRMTDWIISADYQMFKILQECYRRECKVGSNIMSYVDHALDCVVKANMAKGIEKVDGKIVKGPDYVSPLEPIYQKIKDTEQWK